MKTETEQEIALRRLDQLVKALLVLSFPADRQKEICGVGIPGEDMVLDFDSYYTHARSRYVEQGLLTPGQLEVLDELDRYLESRSGQANAEFWENPESLSSHPDWEQIRGFARACLVSLGKSDLDLEVFHEVEDTSAPDGKPLRIQTTQMKLIQKNSTS